MEKNIVNQELDRRQFLKGFAAVAAAAAIAPSIVACGSSSSTGIDAAEATSTGSDAAEATSTGSDAAAASTGALQDPTEAEPITWSTEEGELRYLAEVNAVYFTEPTRHGVVYEGGSNGDKSVLRGLGDEKEFYNACIEMGWKPGDNVEMKVPDVTVEGEALDLTVKWDGQKEIPFQDIITCDQGDYTQDFRFGGNLAHAEEKNTGCVVCLDSCAVGIVSDAAWPTMTFDNGNANFYGNQDVLPADGTRVIVTFRKRA